MFLVHYHEQEEKNRITTESNMKKQNNSQEIVSFNEMVLDISAAIELDDTILDLVTGGNIDICNTNFCNINDGMCGLNLCNVNL